MNEYMKKRWKLIAIGSCIFIILLMLGTCSGGVLSPIPFLYLNSFEGKVIDAETKQPIPGAAVLAVYYKSGPSVGGSISIPVDAQETLTDDKGQFRIPMDLSWFRFHRGMTNGKINIFKPGYGSFPGHKYAQEYIGLNSKNGSEGFAVYALPPLSTYDERKKNARVRPYDEITYSKRKMYVKVINAERKILGLPLMQEAEEEQ